MPHPTVPAVQDSRQLWSALHHLHLPWGEPTSAESLILTPEVTLHLSSDEGLEWAWASLYASEEFWDLLAGEGEYDNDELDDPDSVMEERNDKAVTLLEQYQREAETLFGEAENYGEDFTPRVVWHLPQLTLSLEVTQADKEVPIEVRLTLLPPGQLPEDWI